MNSKIVREIIPSCERIIISIGQIPLEAWNNEIIFGFQHISFHSSKQERINSHAVKKDGREGLTTRESARHMAPAGSPPRLLLSN